MRVRVELRRRLATTWRRFWWPTLDPDLFAASDCVVAHEWLTSASGSDKVAAALVDAGGAVALVCLSVRADTVKALGITVPVHQSRIGPWASSGRRWQLALPLMPLIWSAVDLGRARLVITSSHSCVNSIPPSVEPDARRVCYCHTPVRYGWEWRMEQGRLPRLVRPLLRPGAWLLRRWDRHVSDRVDVFVANSRFVADRISRSYGRDATVIHPPIDTDRFVPARSPRRDGYLMAGRAVPYKRTDVAVAAAERSGQPLVVAGQGPDFDRLRGSRSPLIRFVASPSDDEMVELMQHARAVLLPGIEDFGMVVVEAQACGTPVIVRAEGGALEATDPAISGPRVDSDLVDDWAEALGRFDRAAWPSDQCRRDLALRFSHAEFRRQVVSVLHPGQFADRSPVAG